MGHRERYLEERLDAPERLRQREQLRASGDAPRLGFSVAHLERDHPAKGAHLPLSERLLRMGLEPRVVDARHARVAFEESRDREGVL
jgi:hypothetical protein